MDIQNFQILAVVGPTAVGKSALVLSLAEGLSTEIISADSMQVYRGMDIGTAKPSQADQTRVRHHGIDLVDPWEPFTVADYCRLANDLLTHFHKSNRPIVMCGGTGLYFKALFEGLAAAPAPDYDLRHQLEQQAQSEGLLCLYERLSAIDPQAAAVIHPNDQKRIIRALEIFLCTGQTKTSLEKEQQQRNSNLVQDPLAAGGWMPYVKWIGLKGPWDWLDARINQRVEQMLENGLVEEVKILMGNSQAPLSHTARQALGYKELIDVINGIISYSDGVAQIKQRTRRYARRQMTWFRANPAIEWLEVDSDP